MHFIRNNSISLIQWMHFYFSFLLKKFNVTINTKKYIYNASWQLNWERKRERTHKNCFTKMRNMLPTKFLIFQRTKNCNNNIKISFNLTINCYSYTKIWKYKWHSNLLSPARGNADWLCAGYKVWIFNWNSFDKKFTEKRAANWKIEMELNMK